MTDWQMFKMFMGFVLMIFGAILGEKIGMIVGLLIVCNFATNKKRVHRPRKA